jgi:hypothetical protein
MKAEEVHTYLLPKCAGTKIGNQHRLGQKAMKRTSSKTAVTMFDLAMLASIGLASAGAFYGILRLGIWLAVQ